MKYKIQKQSNSYFILTYNLILVFNSILEANEKAIVKKHLLSVSKTFQKTQNIDFLLIKVYQDKVHIVFRTNPRTPLDKFITSFKTTSSRLIKKNYPNVIKQKQFWTNKYFIFTPEEFDMNELNEYIKNLDK